MKKISEFIKNPFFSGSMVMIIGSNATNFLNYLYHLLMGRVLGPASYGDLAVLLSLMALVGMIPLSLGLVVTKFISSAKSEEEKRNLSSSLNKKVFVFAVAIFLLVAVSSPILSAFLNIKEAFMVVIIASVFLFLLPSTFNRAILQGLLRFKELVISIVLENSSKVILSVILVLLGFKVFGSLVGLLIAVIFGWVLSRYYVKDYLSSKIIRKINFKPVLLYSFPIAIQSLTITSLYSMDVVLVKHFFSTFDAGIYASLSTLGRIIFFGTSPIINVMFPLVAKRKSEGGNYKKIFSLSLLLTLLVALGIVFIYWIFPELSIKLLYGSLFLQAAPYLVYFGIFITLLVLANLFISYYLSLDKVKIVILPILASVGQVIGIYVYHQSLQEIINVSILATALLVITLFVYFGYERSMESKLNFRNSPCI